MRFLPDIGDELSQRIQKYIQIEAEALKALSVCVPQNSSMRAFADSSLEMIRSYFEDAKYFNEKGDLINALSALNYSYGWIDSGVRLGIFKTDGDYRKFTFFK